MAKGKKEAELRQNDFLLRYLLLPFFPALMAIVLFSLISYRWWGSTASTIICLLSVVTSAAVIFWFFLKKYREFLEAEEARRKASEALTMDLIREIEDTQAVAGSFLSSNCSAALQAVEYLGWEGTIHHFRFANASYAELFRNANRQGTP
jgi:hypothetical protein